MWGGSIAGWGPDSTPLRGEGARALACGASVSQGGVRRATRSGVRGRRGGPAAAAPRPPRGRPRPRPSPAASPQAAPSLPRGPLRHLDGDGPIRVLVPAAAGGLEVQLLQALGDGADAARAHRAVVHLDDGRYLEARAREEDLVGGVELRAADLALEDRHPELLLRELHHRVARDALEDVGSDGRGDELPLPDEKDVRSTRLGDLPVLGEEDGVVVPGPLGLVHGERRVDVGARALGARGNRVIGGAAPGGDADPQTRELHVVAHRDREDRELRAALEVDPHRLARLVRQRPDVGVLAGGVAPEYLKRDVAELVYRVRHVEPQEPAALLEPLVVLAQFQDLQGPAFVAPVGPDALEDAGPVVEGVGGGGEAHVAQLL